MPEFVSKPRVKEGISPSDPRDLTTKEYVDGRNLEDLANVDLAGVAPGDLITFDGEDWLPTADPAVNSIFFDTETITEADTAGQLVWDTDFDTLAFVLEGGDAKVQIGQETLYRVKNQTGSSIPKGTAVGFAGTLGNSGRLLVKPFIADGSEPSQYFVGIATETIPAGEDGYVTHFGKIRRLDTSAFSDGDILYVSSTQAGGFATSPPLAPNNIIQVAAVINSNATTGVIFVRPTLGSNINVDEGVQIQNPQNQQVLVYRDGVWVNESAPPSDLTFADGGGPENAVRLHVSVDAGQIAS